MFFENENLVFNLLDVLELKQTDVSMFNKGRNFSALSFRFRADTWMRSGGEELHLRENSVSYVPTRLDYHREATVDEMIVIHLDVINYHTKEIEVIYTADPTAVGNLFRRLLDCWNAREAGYRYRCSAMVCEILALCHVPKSSESKIVQSVAYMKQHFRNGHLTMREIAAQSFMSEVYFRKLFRREYGTSPQKFLVDLRIQHAVGLISTGYFSLKEIAEQSGYNDYKYFSVEFKKATGVSPSAYLYNYK